MPAHLADPDHNPSFTRGIFLGELRENLLHPFPAPDKDTLENLTAILDSFRAFAKEKIDTAKQDHDGKFPDDVRAGMAELGLMGLNIPEEYGGFGASAIVTNRVFGEIGATDASFMTPVGIPTYGFTGMFFEPDGSRLHGLNERLRASVLYEARDYMAGLVRIYAQQK